MSFTKIAAAATAAALLTFSTGAYAGAAGGGTELPSNAEPNQAKNPAEKKMDGQMEKGGSMEKGGMQKGGAMKKGDDKM